MARASESTAKGAARREAILLAAARLVTEHGPDAVSHRAVAGAAGVPLAATTYYFAGLDDLLAAAVARVIDGELDAASTVVAAIPRRRSTAPRAAAAVVAVLLGPDRSTDPELLAYYERFVATGRHPVLRPVLRAARERVDALLSETLDRCGHRDVDVPLLVAVVDGTVLSALVEGDGRAREKATTAVTRLLAGAPVSAG